MAKKERIGIVGGRFDPVRSSHIHAALTLLDSGSVDRVLLLLSGEGALISAEDRWKMLVAACACDKRMIPSRLCLDMDADPCSGAVMKELSKLYPDAKLRLLPDVSDTSEVSVEEDLPVPVLEYCRCKGLCGFPHKMEHIDLWMDHLFTALKPRRFAHSLSVARTSVQLAELYGENPLKAEQAGLLHDCAKCLSLDEMRKIARKHQLTDDPEFLASASLLHSVVGACVAREDYGMEDPEVLEAIAYHNTGCAGMSRLAMCVCLADFIEPNRTPFPGLAEVRRLSEVSLERALLLSLESVADHVRSGGRSLHPRTLGAIEWLRTLPAVQSAPAESGAVNKEKES